MTLLGFFMTIPEAAQLVLDAGCRGAGGELFVLDMGEPVKIYDLAKRLILLSGLREGEDIKIEVTGFRPGEKLHEELFYDPDKVERTANPKIYKSMDDFNSGICLEELKGDLNQTIVYDSPLELLKKYLPEFKV